MTQTAQRAPEVGAGRRFSGVLPDRLLRRRRPVWWQEVALIAVGYWLYSLGSDAISAEARIARRHARAVAQLQAELRIGWERRFNHFVARQEWLAQGLDYFYATAYIGVTLGVLIWLFRRHAEVYRGIRTVLVTLTLLALLCFYVYPSAPPRLVPGLGYIDTVARFDTWGSLAQPAIAAHSNQFAAMPSLHFGWALWSGLAIFAYARHRWARLLGLAYPAATFVAIVGTGNHFVLDAVGGGAVVALSFGIQWVLSGRGAFDPPPDPPDAYPHALAAVSSGSHSGGLE